MLGSIASLPPIAGVLFLTLILAIAAFLIWVAELSRLAPAIQTCSGVVAPYAATLSVLFSLFMVFLVQDIWVNRDKAQAAVAREADGIRQLRAIGAVLGERAEAFNGLVTDYARAATAVNWRTPQQQAATRALIGRMLQENLSGPRSIAEAAVQSAAKDAIADVRTGHRDRFLVVASPSARQKWVAAFILGVITQIALVLVHLGKPRASALASVLFGTAMAFVLWITLVRVDPFVGIGAISLQPILAAAGTTP